MTHRFQDRVLTSSDIIYSTPFVAFTLFIRPLVVRSAPISVRTLYHNHIVAIPQLRYIDLYTNLDEYFGI